MLGVRGGVRLKQWGKGRTSASSYTGSKRSASRSRRLQGTIASCATVSRSGSRTGCPSCCPSPRTRSAGAERQSLSCVSSASTSSETLVATARRRRHTASAVAPRVSAPTEPARRGRRDLSYWWSSECVCVCVCVCVCLGLGRVPVLIERGHAPARTTAMLKWPCATPLPSAGSRASPHPEAVALEDRPAAERLEGRARGDRPSRCRPRSLRRNGALPQSRARGRMVGSTDRLRVRRRAGAGRERSRTRAVTRRQLISARREGFRSERGCGRRGRSRPG
jgi:hypothetical protein